MNIDVIIGLALLFFVYRAFRAFLQAINTAKTNKPTAQATPVSSVPSTPSYRGPRDLSPRPSAPGSVPRAALRMKTAMTKPSARLPSNQSGAPFVIDRQRRFPVLGILAVAAIIVLISSCYAWINEPPRRPAPGRHAEHTLHLHGGAIAFERVSSPAA